jgi:hypothetical protein
VTVEQPDGSRRSGCFFVDRLDWGVMIAGHGGMLDRVDSICFAAPIFFHLTRYFFALPAA